jgi:hypothetical protein
MGNVGIFLNTHTIILVRNCTVHRAENKPSSKSLSLFLFVTCKGEKIYFLDVHYGKHIHDINSVCGVCKCKKLLVGMVALFKKFQTSVLAGPMLRVNCLIFSPIAQPPVASLFPLPAHTCEY